MTTPDFRAQCSELVDALENARRIIRGGDGTLHIDTAEPVLRRAYALLDQSTTEPPKNCWLDDEPDLFPSPCVFDDPDEVINNCTYARTVKCKTDCKYYRVAAHPEPVQAPPPQPPTDEAEPKPVAWMYRGEPSFDGTEWREIWKVTTDKRLAEYKAKPDQPIPLFSVLYRAAATTPTPEPPTDEEIDEWTDAPNDVPDEMPSEEELGEYQCLTKKGFRRLIRAALERWGNEKPFF
tara:strand:- start:33 stop:740 length:708 start_codon:yes stop_codon:yes gene_type:complete